MEDSHEVGHHQEPTYKSQCQIMLIVINISLSCCFVGWAMVYFGAIPIATSLDIYHVTIDKHVAEGIINGCIPVGSLLGALGCSLLTKRLSRRKALLLVNAVALVAGAAVFIPNFYTVVLSRLIQGLCVGAATSLPTIIIKQIAPVEISGMLGSLVQTAIVVAMSLCYFMVYVLIKATNDQTCRAFWPYVFGMSELILVFQSAILIFVFPYETPKYWLQVRRQDKAKELIQTLYKPEYVEMILQQKKNDMKIQQQTVNEVPDTQQSLLSVPQQGQETSIQSSSRRLTFIVACHLAISNQLSGTNAACIYCGPIASKSTTGELTLLMPTFVMLANTIGALLAGIFLRTFGRKPLLLSGLSIQSIMLCIIGTGFLIKQHVPAVSQVMAVVGLFAFQVSYGSTLGSIVWVYIPEIVSPSKVSIAITCNWICTSLVVILFPIIQAHLLGDNPGAMFFFFAAWCISAIVLHSKCMVETKNKTELQIRQEYQQLKIC